MRALALLLLAAAPAWCQCLQPLAPPPDPLAETRICGAPARYASGEIKRSSAVIAAFRRIHPCPSTGLTTGSCPGWQADHVLSLAAGGCDAVSNLQWLPVQIKTCAADWCKDRWERKVYAPVPQIVVIP
jgi:hypothetical protein